MRAINQLFNCLRLDNETQKLLDGFSLACLDIPHNLSGEKGAKNLFSVIRILRFANWGEWRALDGAAWVGEALVGGNSDEISNKHLRYIKSEKRVISCQLFCIN